MGSLKGSLRLCTYVLARRSGSYSVPDSMYGIHYFHGGRRGNLEIAPASSLGAALRFEHSPGQRHGARENAVWLFEELREHQTDQRARRVALLRSEAEFGTILFEERSPCPPRSARYGRSNPVQCVAKPGAFESGTLYGTSFPRGNRQFQLVIRTPESERRQFLPVNT